ncbi:hypothetical protein D9757_008679 [Collybiopsis confluens]|uniref:Peptidase A1 domain-containing protein n=1 Tax=Collybiopsis confluens TaxID=2823264 RepID=A0A8H5H414_9AGAR|nr:hypothetical protein D9757_008679 [Collybiopsis confluens]
MFSVTSLLAFVILASRTSGNPVVVIDRSPILSLPLSRINNFTSGHDILAHDLARARHFKDLAKARATGQPLKRQSEPVINTVVQYIASVGVGASNSQYQLVVDTGSSNTWVGAGQVFTPSSTSTNTGEEVGNVYGSGVFVGFEWIDRVSLTSNLVIEQQSIGVAEEFLGFAGVDGILGIGPVLLTEGTIEDGSTIPTVTDNLFSQGTIAENVVSVYFQPPTSEEDSNGELFFGGTDSSKFTGEITFVPKVTNWWGISESVTYGSTSIVNNAQGIVDTGTTLILLNTNSFNAYIEATGAVFDSTTGLYRITLAQFENLQNLDFNIGGTTFSLTPDAQIFPLLFNADIGGSPGGIYLMVGDLGDEEGFDLINGFAFLERFYTVLDTTNSRVGFATTAFTNSTIN